MRELFKQYMYVPKHEKISEKAFLGRITVSVIVILACLFGMAFSAYAFFADNIYASNNMIVAANYDLDWIITVDGQQSIKTGILLGDEADVPKDYVVSISTGAESTADTGFCIIEVDFGNDNTTDLVYHTAQIGTDVNAPGGKRTNLEFTLRVNQLAYIKFTPHWGTSTSYGYDGETAYYITDTSGVVEIGTVQQPGSVSDEPGETVDGVSPPLMAVKPSTTTTATSTTASTAETTASAVTTTTTAGLETTASSSMPVTTTPTVEDTTIGETTATDSTSAE